MGGGPPEPWLVHAYWEEVHYTRTLLEIPEAKLCSRQCQPTAFLRCRFRLIMILPHISILSFKGDNLCQMHRTESDTGTSVNGIMIIMQVVLQITFLYFTSLLCPWLPLGFVVLTHALQKVCLNNQQTETILEMHPRTAQLAASIRQVKVHDSGLKCSKFFQSGPKRD